MWNLIDVINFLCFYRKKEKKLMKKFSSTERLMILKNKLLVHKTPDKISPNTYDYILI